MPSSDKPLATADGNGRAARSHEIAAIPWFAKPPARNVPLLIVSIALMVIWLVLLTWLALTVRGQRDTIKGAEGSRAAFDEPFSCRGVY